MSENDEHTGASREPGPGRRRKPLLLKRGPKYVREKLQGKYRLLPSFITVLAIFCGFLAIISSIKGEFQYATKCVLLAIVLDGLDGRVARRLNACSEFGKEFDSLSDVMSFGVAPAVMVFCWAFAAYADELGLVACFIFVVCSATRLARFNVMSSEKSTGSFTGLPTPGAAAAIVSLVYCFPARLESLPLIGLMMGYMVLIGVLMVSTLPFMSIKKLEFLSGNSRLNLILLAAAVAITWKYSAVVIFTVSTVYALSSPLLYLAQKSFPSAFPQVAEGKAAVR